MRLNKTTISIVAETENSSRRTEVQKTKRPVSAREHQSVRASKAITEGSSGKIIMHNSKGLKLYESTKHSIS